MLYEKLINIRLSMFTAVIFLQSFHAFKIHSIPDLFNSHYRRNEFHCQFQSWKKEGAIMRWKRLLLIFIKILKKSLYKHNDVGFNEFLYIQCSWNVRSLSLLATHATRIIKNYWARYPTNKFQRNWIAPGIFKRGIIRQLEKCATLLWEGEFRYADHAKCTSCRC